MEWRKTVAFFYPGKQEVFKLTSDGWMGSADDFVESPGTKPLITDLSLQTLLQLSETESGENPTIANVRLK